MKTLIGKLFLVCLAAIMLVPASVLAQSGENDGCTNATLHGDYAFKVSGQIFPPGSLDFPPTALPVQRDGVAMTRFNGQGGLTQVDFLMSNGSTTMGPSDPLTGFHVGETGWYKVFPDCTGMAEIRFPTPPGGTSGAVIDLMLVISNHGNTIHTIVSHLVPPNASAPVPASIHSDAEKLGGVGGDD